jgi:predicted dinucleotide-binding enzyme
LFAGVPGNVVVVDTGNYYPRQRDGVIPEIEAGLPESRWVERQIGRPVVKAFNKIYAKHLMENGRPRGDARRIALPLSGDDPKRKRLS